MTALRTAREVMRSGMSVRQRGAVDQGAFTLVEVLVVTAILALVVGVIGACLVGGFRVWDSARNCNRLDGQAIVALAILERDLMNSQPFHEIEFAGEASRLAFAGLVPSVSEGRLRESDRAEGSVERLGTIRYVFDPRERSLVRSSEPFPPAGAAGSRVEKILDGVRSVRFRYRSGPLSGSSAGGDPSGPGDWREDWRNATNTPGLVRVDLVLGDERHPFEIGRTFVRPVQAQKKGGGR